MPRPLSGVRIVDLTIAVAGPVGTSLLGSLGAEVIKIENTTPRQGARMPNATAVQRASGFMELNRDKLGITLNLNHPLAREVVKRLVAVSDVVTDNFSPRVMRNFGLEYDELVKIKPDIIAVSMPAFGKTGPLRDRTSFGPGIDAMSGLSDITGYRDSTPLKPGNFYCDYNAGVHAAFAVMAALHSRRRTGKGQFIEVAMRDGETQLLGEYILDYVLNGRVAQRDANSHSTVAPHNVYRCRGEDKWIAITAENDEQWAALCRVMGRPELAEDPKFATVTSRKHNEESIDAIIGEWTKDREHIPAMHELQRAGVPAAAVMTTEEVANDPQFQHRDTFPRVDLAGGSEFIRLPRAGWIAKEATVKLGRGPEYSEHTLRILRDLAKLSEEEIQELASAGATVLPQVAEEVS